jgi:hypothetical protein
VKTLILFLTLTLTAQAATTPAAPASSPAPTETKASIPAVPADYAQKILGIVVQVKDAQLEQVQLSQKFQQTVQKISDLNERGKKLESEMLKSLGLDPLKYTTQTTEDGKVVIVSLQK